MRARAGWLLRREVSPGSRVKTGVVHCAANAVQVAESLMDLALLQHLYLEESLVLRHLARNEGTHQI